MIFYLLTILDFFAGVSIVLAHYGVLTPISIFFCGYLIIKGLIFIKDIASIIDILAGVYIMFAILGVQTPLYIVFLVYFTLKTLFAFIPFN